MKRVFAVLMVVTMVIAGNSVYGQYYGEMPPPGMGPGMGPQGMNPEEMAKREVARLTKQLDLSKEQAAKIETIYKEQMEERMAKRHKEMQNGQRPDRETMMQQMKAEREQLNAKIMEILTPEQQVKFREILDSQERRGMDRGRKGPGPDKKHKEKR
ncbi:MAG: hypothetical protein IKY70_00170 [Bacteroidales bacterium]|nr:hypothetical protein [Bacteroidales bacterium]